MSSHELAHDGELSRVLELSELARLPLRARWKLRAAKSRGDSGVLLYAVLREPTRGIGGKWSVVSVRRHGERLCFCSRTSKSPKFVRLTSGSQEILLSVVRKGGGSSSLQAVDLPPGGVLVVICEPVQANVFCKRSPEIDTWWIGIR